MRKFILLIFIAFIADDIKSQINYFNYLDYSSEWRTYASGWNGWCCIDEYYKTTYFDGDTIINNNHYYKQYTLTRENNLQPTLGDVSFIREDSSGHFLSYSITSGTETLIFDNQLIASSQIGDPFPYVGANCNVQYIDTVNFNARQLMHIYGAMSPLNTGSMEGIGFIGLACVMGVEGNSNLNCYSKQGNTIHFGSIDCNLFPLPQRTSIGVIEITKPEINIYPNPTSSKLNISNTKEIGGKKMIYIKNYFGQTVLSSPFVNQIDVSSLSNGMYFIVIQDELRSESIKFVKQ